MAPHLAYRRSAAASWNRIDLLLIVYDVGVDTARSARDAALAGNATELTRLQLKMQQVVIAILDGLDPAQREMAGRIEQLCLFIVDRSQQGAAADWDAVLAVLSTLREGFAGIREQAAEMEASGEIPSLESAAPAISAIA